MHCFQVSLDAANISRLEDGKFIDVNEAFIKYTGYAREEVIGRTVREFNLWVNPEDRKKMTESLRQNSISLNLEAGFRRKDGTTIWGVLSASKIELDGAPCVLTVVRDITEAKAAAERLAEAQNALRSSEEHYRTVFQTSIDAIGITRLEDGVFIDVNQAFCRIHGFERDEVIGRTALNSTYGRTLRSGRDCSRLCARIPPIGIWNICIQGRTERNIGFQYRGRELNWTAYPASLP